MERHPSTMDTTDAIPPVHEIRQRQQSFMKLLRTGVHTKIQQQQQQHDNEELREATSPWQALAWRNAYSLDPFFEETVCGRPLRIKQLLQGELTGFGTGLTVWPAACLLLKHLEYRFTSTHSLSSLHDKLVVELGSGTGAVGIAAAMLGADRVVLTDVPKILFLLETNVQLAQEECGGHLHIDVESYEWGATPTAQLLTENGSRPDIVLVSDCILPRLYPIEPLVDALDQLCGDNTLVIISYEPRYYEQFDPKTRFWTLMQDRHFTISEITRDQYHPHYRADDIEVWEAKRTKQV